MSNIKIFMSISDWPSLSKTGKNIDGSGDHKIVHCLSGIAEALVSMTKMIYVMHIAQNPNEAKVYSFPEHRCFIKLKYFNFHQFNSSFECIIH